MTDEAIRIAIAKLHGWTFHETVEARIHGELITLQQTWIFDDGSGDYIYAKNPTHDYPNDLNAIHEAENRLSDEAFARFYHTLTAMFLEITKGRSSMGKVSANARQRCECLLRALNLWRDE